MRKVTLVFIFFFLLPFLILPQTKGGELTGTWKSSHGLIYEITHRDNHYIWRVHGSDERGEITPGSGQMHAKWHGRRGHGSATGRIVARDNRGIPMKIQWSNGVIYTRINRGKPGANDQMAAFLKLSKQLEASDPSHYENLLNIINKLPL